MKRCALLLVVAAAMWMPATACVDPMSPYSAGVVFSGGERFEPQRIELFAQDASGYIESCTTQAVGLPIVTGTAPHLDPLTIDTLSVTGNVLRITVSYSGGCKEHDIALFTDGALLKSNPAQINLMVSHDANGESCEALVTRIVEFDCGSLDIEPLLLRIFAPGETEPFTVGDTLPLWTPSPVETCSYKLRGAYSGSIMAHVGCIPGSFGDGPDNRVLLVFDSSGGIPGEDVKAAAMKAELERLRTIGVVSLSDSVIERIGAALAEAQGGQFWTAEDTVLQFNMWFDGTAMQGVKGVNGVRGCGIGVAYELPGSLYSPTAVVRAPGEFKSRTGRWMSARAAGGEVRVRFPSSSVEGSVRLIDLSGRVAASVPFSRNTTEMVIRGNRGRLPAGCYMVAIVENNEVVQSELISVAGD